MKAMTEPTWRLLLPADWWQIPLGDPQAREAEADALVEHQCRALDDGPEATKARSRVRDEVRGMAEAAAENDGRMLAISTAVVGGVPLACVLIVGLTRTEGRHKLNAHRLAREIDHGASIGTDVTVATLPKAGAAVRRHYQRDERPDPHGDPIRTTVVDYHVPIPDQPGALLRMTFSTPQQPPVVEAAVTLWDAIAESLVWTSPPPEARVGAFGQPVGDRA